MEKSIRILLITKKTCKLLYHFFNRIQKIKFRSYEKSNLKRNKLISLRIIPVVRVSGPMDSQFCLCIRAKAAVVKGVVWIGVFMSIKKKNFLE